MQTTEHLTSTFHLNWQEDFKNSIRTREQLSSFITTQDTQNDYPLFIPKPFLAKIIESGPSSPLWRQFIPSEQEQDSRGLNDPIGDDLYSKGNGLIHRYKNRVLFSPTEICPILCRYCFRKNELLQGQDTFKANLEGAANYLEDHQEVEEVILTGGDPLILSNTKLEQTFERLAKIKHITMIRLHSRTPVILPNRIDEQFIALLEKYAKRFFPISLVIHTNHLSEWSPEFLNSLAILRKTSINLMSQSVLLKDVNNNLPSLKILFTMLMKNGVRPYYLHHPDPVKGGMHFLLDLKEGQKLYAQLKEEMSGFVLPRYVVEQPQGKGKTFAMTTINDERWINQ